LSTKERKTYNREFKQEAVRLITEKGYSIAEASRNLGLNTAQDGAGKSSWPRIPKTHFPVKGN
jgi:transposase